MAASHCKPGVLLTRPRPRPAPRSAIVTRLLDDRAKGSQIGRIRLLMDKPTRLEGAAFDVPPALAAEIMEREGELRKRGVELSMPTSLPPEEDLYSPAGGRGGRGGRYALGRGRECMG